MAKLNWTFEETQALSKEQYQALTAEEKIAVRRVREASLLS